MSLHDIVHAFPVAKMHGCGNDFLVFPDFQEQVTAEQAKFLCDRHYGVGADGLVLIAKSRNPNAQFRMKFFNPDGSLSEMCGNGIRCFAKYVKDIRLVDDEEKFIMVDTDAGLKETEIITRNGDCAIVKVNMGIPSLYNPSQINLDPKYGRIQMPWPGLGQFTFVSMGNPHAVFSEVPDAMDIKTVGPTIETNPVFPQRTNVEFTHLNDQGELEVKVWERGAGLTLACGTGACAAYVAAHIEGRVIGEIPVRLPGGILKISWRGEGSSIYMAGPAENVYRIDPKSIRFPEKTTE